MANPSIGSDLQVRRERRRPGENRIRLILAGIQIFSINGFYGTSTKDISQLADVPQPHVYTNFRSKQDLFNECAYIVFDEILFRCSVRGNSRQPSIALDINFQVLCVFLFQTVSVMRNPELRSSLSSHLGHLRESLNSQQYSELLLVAASHLIAPEP